MACSMWTSPVHIRDNITAPDMTGPVGILWDMENCPVPVDVNSDDVAGNIRMALRVHPAVEGSVTMFSAYGDFNHFPRRLREGCQRTGINLIDVPNGRKDASDKAILVDMFLFALDNPPPCTILLISGDVDFAPALHKLGQRGYTVVLALPARLGVAPALCNAGRYVWDWPSVARGDGFVPVKVLRGRSSSPNFVGACHSSEDSDHLNEDEDCRHSGNAAIELVKKGSPSGGMCNQSRKRGSTSNGSGRTFSGRSHCRDSHNCSGVDCQWNPMQPPTSQRHTQFRATTEVEKEDLKSWVQPGDFEGLKRQLVQLLLQNGGSVDFVKLPSVYSRAFGRPLYLAEYGSLKLAHLLIKMQDVFITISDGVKKKVRLRECVPAIQTHVTEKLGGRKVVGDLKEEAPSLEDDPDLVEEVILLQAQVDDHPKSHEGGGHGCAKAMLSKLEVCRQGLQQVPVHIA